MRPGVTPHHVSSLIPFQKGTGTISPDECSALSAVSKDGKFLWLVNGPAIEVLSVATRCCISSWVFGVTLKDTHSYITCVKECCGQGKLLVGVCNSAKSSMVCLLDIRSSKVTKAIEIPHKVSSIEVVTTVGGDFIPRWALNDQLRLFYGIIAVGTISGIVYLVDLSLDGEVYSDEVIPSKLQYVTPRSRDVAERRKQALSKGNNLCLVVDEESHGNFFKYRRCDGVELQAFNPDEVVVTCLKYIPQIGTLVVGFSFGSFQLWKLNVPVLEYSSRVDVESGCVLHVAYQEPENDPKNFCYLWVVRGGEVDEEESISSSSLYQLAYNKKTWYSNYGAFYEELASVSLRFELDLIANLFNNTSNPTTSSRAITAYTLENPNYSPPSKLNDDESFEESVHGPDLSRCLFVWESMEGQKKTYQMAIFDMNRWYHAQMPAALRCVGSSLDTCPYLSLHSLDDAISKADYKPLLDVHVYTERMIKFINTSPLPPEQHFYPASLAFDALLVTEVGLIKGHFLGTQRQVLATMEKVGPAVLLNCKELYHTCIYMGLLPRHLDGTAQSPSVTAMRESLLSMALEYNMLPFLIKCVNDWSPGEYVHHGCTLKFLLEWAWSRVVQIKSTVDNLCTGLYDWSGHSLDSRSLQTLDQAYQKLAHLTAVFKCLLSQSISTTEEGYIQLQNKLSVVIYISQHLQVVLWFVRAGLLPENDELEENLLPGQYSYPVTNLIMSFDQRRQELRKIHQDIGDADLLMIDGLVKEMGPSVRDLWNKEGGKGLYPPPSLHALLSVYLLEDIDVTMKHALVLYCLLDLVSLVDPSHHEQFSEKITRFTKAFGIPFPLVKQIQGFWLLDHKDFEESVTVMLHPLVTKSLGSWQHYRIVKALLYQGESKMALRYISSKQLPLSTPEEVKIKLTVLLANGLTAEALEYQRTYRDQDNMEDLLQHLFLGCQQTKTVDQLLQLPLTDEEELQLIKYLTNSKEPHSQELLVLHFLQRSRYVEAVQLNEKLKHSVASEPNAKARERAAARNAMVDGYLSVLSSVQKKLVFENQTVLKKNTAKRREVRRPQPLSTTVTKNSAAKIVSRTSLFLHILEGVQEIRREEQEEELTADKTDEPDIAPFVGTPITPRARSVFGQSQPVVYAVKEDSNAQKLSWQPSSHLSLTPFNLSKIMSPVSSRRASKIMSADALSMLQTPVPQRRSMSRKRTPTSSVPATPQSILKVRQMISTNNSPQNSPIMSMDKVTEDIFTPSAPGTPRSVSFCDTTMQATPKQLRFAECKTEESKVKSSPPASPKVQRSILRSPPSPKSVKDRSPTPESISRSPKYKSNLDLLQLGPLHDEERQDSNQSPLSSPAAESTDTADDTMDTEVEVDNEITFNFSHHSVKNDGDVAMDNSTDEDAKEESKSTNQPLPAPIQLSSLKKSSILTSPVKLKHSPMKTTGPPRSPTVKLTKSPARGMFQPALSIPDDENPLPTELRGEEPIRTSVTDRLPVRTEEPIEIDDTDEDNEKSDEKHVTFKDDSSGSVHAINDSHCSDEDIDDKINEIENRIYDFAQPEEIENELVEKEMKKQDIFKKRERSVVFSFTVPDSSSDASSEKVSSSEKAEEMVSTTTVTSTQDKTEELEDVATVSESDDVVEASESDEVAVPSESEAVMADKYAKFVSSLTDDIEDQPDQSKIDESKTTEGELPPLMEIDEGGFDNKLPEKESDEEDEEGGSDDEKLDSSKNYPLRKTRARNSVSRSSQRLSSVSEDQKEERELRRSSRRLSSVVKFDEALFIPVPKSPSRTKKIADDETPKSPSRSKGATADSTVSDNLAETAKSPSRRSRKSVQPGDLVTESPGRSKGAKATEEEELPKTPTRGRKSKKADGETVMSDSEEKKEMSSKKSPGRRKSTIKKSPSPSGRKSSMSPSPSRSQSEVDQSLSKSPTPSGKSPGRGRNKKQDTEENSNAVVKKSPGRSRRKTVDIFPTVKEGEETSSTEVIPQVKKSPGRPRRKTTEIFPAVQEGEVSEPSSSEPVTKGKKSPGRSRRKTMDIFPTANEGEDNEKSVEQVKKSPGRPRRKTTEIFPTVEEVVDNSVDQVVKVKKSPGRSRRRTTEITMEVEDTTPDQENVDDLAKPLETVTKSPSRSRRKTTEIFAQVDSDNVNASSDNSKVKKSPGRPRRRTTEIFSELKDVDAKETTQVKKSPGRSRRKTVEIFTEVKSPSRRQKNLADQDEAASTRPKSPSQDMDHIPSEGELLTPPESEMDSPNKTSKAGSNRKGRQSSQSEDKEDISESESEGPNPVFSFSDPMQVDVPTEDFTKVKEASDMQSFIFSPPAAPKTRKSVKNSVTLSENSILLPSSREKTPVRSREGTPVKSTSKRGRSKKGTELDIPHSIDSIPEEPPGFVEEPEIPSESEPPPKKEKKSRRGKKKLLNYDEVNLISPIKEEEGELEPEKPSTRQRSKRDQEMPINLRGGTLMNTRSKKKRVAKLW